MSDQAQGRSQLQNQLTDEFLYFFLRLRKDRIRKVVQRVRDQYPGESTEQLARRLISSKSYLSWISGTLTHLPMLLPGVGQALNLLGFVGRASMMTRMHRYLILEMALLYGKDIDHDARIPEMAAVAGAVGVGASAPFPRTLSRSPSLVHSSCSSYFRDGDDSVGRRGCHQLVQQWGPRAVT